MRSLLAVPLGLFPFLATDPPAPDDGPAPAHLVRQHPFGHDRVPPETAA